MKINYVIQLRVQEAVCVILEKQSKVKMQTVQENMLTKTYAQRLWLN